MALPIFSQPAIEITEPDVYQVSEIRYLNDPAGISSSRLQVHILPGLDSGATDPVTGAALLDPIYNTDSGSSDYQVIDFSRDEFLAALNAGLGSNLITQAEFDDALTAFDDNYTAQQVFAQSMIEVWRKANPDSFFPQAVVRITSAT
jgi:hypothetical protein